LISRVFGAWVCQNRSASAGSASPPITNAPVRPAAVVASSCC
jgi:hypothetical protein